MLIYSIHFGFYIPESYYRKCAFVKVLSNRAVKQNWCCRNNQELLLHLREQFRM